jgi:4-hydroxy-2-oxoheptanedioate aldolase
MPAQNQFKHWLEHRERRWGSWLMSGAPSTAEALGYAGFDFLVVDMEHVPLETPQAIELLRALSATPAQPVVRLAWNDQLLVKKALDIGAQTLMFPFVETAQQAQQAVQATRYPPEGTRGVAAVHRASHYGNDGDYLKLANQQIGVIVQIESLTAIDNLEDIASIQGVDALFIGPGDLAAALGHIGQIAAPAVQETLKALVQRIHRSGKPCGCVAPNAQMAKQFQEYGFDFIAISSDVGFLLRQAKETLSTVKNTQ